MGQEKKLPLFQVDSFANTPFTGNPAGVVLINDEIDTSLMQAIAAEMNLSETAFVTPCQNGFAIRYFTPTMEVPLCGHATLASAHILFTEGYVPKNQELQFFAEVETLSVRFQDGWLQMNFPRYAITRRSSNAALASALGVQIADVYECADVADWLIVRCAHGTNLENLQPNMAELATVVPRLLVVVANDPTGMFDFHVRCFAPNAGIPEDPVTGSAQCALSTLWREELGKESFTVKQVSKRGGILKTEIQGNRIALFGQAVTVFKTELRM